MPRCGFTKPDGGQCRRIVKASEAFCYSHDPDRAGERVRNASKAARSKPVREIRDLKDEVRGVIRAVREEGFDRNDAKVIFAGYALIKDLLVLERDLRIDDELSQEIEELKREIDRASAG
jgi:hypothetical protein